MENLPRIVMRASGFRRAALAVAVIAATAGCGHTTAGDPVRAPTSSRETAVNTAVLDPGHYPTKPQAPLGNAGSDQVGALVEARRMASYLVGPWQVDAALTAHVATDAMVMENYKKMGTTMTWPPIAGGAYGLPYLVGFMSQRHTSSGPPKSLRNGVVRFADSGAATTAANSFFDRAMNMPRTVDVVPIVVEPEQALPVPGHPEAKAALLTFQDQASGTPIKELTVTTSHGPFVLMQVVRCEAGPDCMTQLASRTLDLQLPLIDKFTPTPAGDLATLPLDPTGLVARTLPLPDDEITATSQYAYEPNGALQFEDDPLKAEPALSAAGVDYVSMGHTTVYQAKDADSAAKLAQDYAAIVASAPAASSAAPVPGLPQSRCTLVPGSGGIIPHHWCLTPMGRYMVKAVARQLDTAHQLTAAQYRILNP